MINRFGSGAPTLQVYSLGVRPFRVFSLHAKLYAAMTSVRCVRS